MLKIGMIGMSEGNGHPYSWSAIFNGYDPERMADCPFPVIPQYLSSHVFPEEAIQGARVTHIWTQNRSISKHIAAASKIETIVDNRTDLIGAVDGVILARDDAEKHLEMAAPFLEAGMPLFIDKPFALDCKTADAIFEKAVHADQLFTCSAMRYSSVFDPGAEEFPELGEIRFIDALIGSKWDTYAVHLIESVLSIFPNIGEIIESRRCNMDGTCGLTVNWSSGILTRFTTLGAFKTPAVIRIYGDKGLKEMVPNDTFRYFKHALEHFTRILQVRDKPFARSFVKKVVEVIQRGRIEQ